jgi:ADP-ribose pyrophosphatase YjhB (NUDIX family)
MGGKREYPDRPVVGVGGVVIHDGCVLLIRRGSEPLKGQWSIPGGTLEVGETLEEGVRRELREETALEVRVLDLIEVFERIVPDPLAEAASPPAKPAAPQYHFVIVDYLCEVTSGTPRAGSDVTEVALVREDDLSAYGLTPTATRVVRKAFALARERVQAIG